MKSENALNGSFSSPTATYSFDGVLLDMDGTIVDSTEAIEKHWRALGAELNFDAEILLVTSHGRRSIDTLRILVPEKANWDYVSKIEGEIPRRYGSSATLVPGASELLASLAEKNAKWAIVTSGTHALLHGWLEALSLTPPSISVVAEDVSVGKPDPACYLLGRERIGLPLSPHDSEEVAAHSEPVLKPENRILVVEDAPSGVRAAKAAGCSVLGLATTHNIETIKEAGADWIVRDLKSLTLTGGGANNSEKESTLQPLQFQIAQAWTAEQS